MFCARMAAGHGLWSGRQKIPFTRGSSVLLVSIKRVCLITENQREISINETDSAIPHFTIYRFAFTFEACETFPYDECVIQ